VGSIPARNAYLEGNMENTESKHLEKSFNRVIQFLYKEDREVVLDMVEHKYQSALQKSKLRSEFLKRVADNLPFAFLFLMLVITASIVVIAYIIISVSFEERLFLLESSLKQEHTEIIENLQSEISFLKKSNELSLNNCIDRIVSCENEKSKE
jgi:hypothetical protein